jgi:SAM-dependent methyltransferase
VSARAAGCWRSGPGPDRPPRRWPNVAARSSPSSWARTWPPSPDATSPASPQVQIISAAFEDWPLPIEPFDVVLAATAFHWIDPAVRVGKAADALRPGGVLATIATHHIAGGDKAFFDQAQACYQRWDPDTPPGVRLPTAAQVPAASDELDRSGRFGPVVFRRYEWEQSYSTASYLEVLLTYSGHRALEPTAQANLLDCIATLIDTGYGGRISKRYLTELRTAHLQAL